MMNVDKQALGRYDNLASKKTVLIACGHPLLEHPNAIRMLNFGKMLKRDYDVFALGYVCDDSQDLSFELDGIHCFQFSFNTNRSVSAKLKKRTEQKQKLKDFLRGIPTPVCIITAASFYDVLQGAIRSYAKEWSCPIIQSVCEWYDKNNDNFAGLMGKIKFLLNRYQLISYNVKCGNEICISSLLNKYYESKGCHCIRITTTVDIKEFKIYDNTQKDSETLHLMYAGSPKKKDYLGNMIGGIALLDEQNKSSIRFDVFGVTYGQAKKELNLSEQTLMELDGIVVFHGRVPHDRITEALQEADFTVLLRPDARYANAGFPTKVGESMASGVPVIANITSDLEMYILDGKTGLICKDESDHSFAETLIRAVSLKNDEIDRMKIEARKMAEEHFEYSKFSEALTSFIGKCRR